MPFVSRSETALPYTRRPHMFTAVNDPIYEKWMICGFLNCNLKTGTGGYGVYALLSVGLLESGCRLQPTVWPRSLATLSS